MPAKNSSFANPSNNHLARANYEFIISGYEVINRISLLDVMAEFILMPQGIVLKPLSI